MTKHCLKDTTSSCQTLPNQKAFWTIGTLWGVVNEWVHPSTALSHLLLGILPPGYTGYTNPLPNCLELVGEGLQQSLFAFSAAGGQMGVGQKLPWLQVMSPHSIPVLMKITACSLPSTPVQCVMNMSWECQVPSISCLCLFQTGEGQTKEAAPSTGREDGSAPTHPCIRRHIQEGIRGWWIQAVQRYT